MKGFAVAVLFNAVAILLSRAMGHLAGEELGYTLAAIVSLNIGVVLGGVQERIRNRRRGGDSQ